MSTAQPDDPQEVQSTAFEDLVARCLEEFDSGGTAAVEGILASHPDQADKVKDALKRLHGSGLLKVTEEDEFPDRMGEFQLLRRIGGGGMGVVFLARQESLDREVALKLVRPDYLYFENAKKRFRREVLAVSRLLHPGIVPVFHVGEEDNIPYFAMEYVPGCSMAEVLAQARKRGKGQQQRPGDRRGVTMLEALQRLRPDDKPGDASAAGQLFAGSWEQTCLRICLQVAEALCHAHEQQIIHRDIKPSNIMITVGGQVRLVDFGLASLESDEKLTRSNAMLGSLNYMSPEQITQDEIDERSDVYSLGTTLYQLLTLEIPFGTADQAQIREKILQGNISPVRRRNPAVSRDTETIIEKAMATRREHRYRDIQDLATDLRNLLELRPIFARPPSMVRRSTRWVQRNPVLSMALLLLVVLSLSSFSLWWQAEQKNTEIQAANKQATDNLHKAEAAAAELQQANTELGEKNAELARTNQELAAANTAHERAQEKARENLDRAKEAISKMLTRVSQSRLSVLPSMSNIRRSLLRDARTLYTELAQSELQDEELQQELAAVELRIGGLNVQMGDFADAELHFDAAIKRIRELHGKDPNYETTFYLGEALTNRAALARQRRNISASTEYLQEALQLMEPIKDAALAEDVRYGRTLCSAYRQCANLYIQSGVKQPSEGLMARDFGWMALNLRLEIATKYPKSRRDQESLAREYRRLGSRRIEQGAAMATPAKRLEAQEIGVKLLHKALDIYAKNGLLEALEKQRVGVRNSIGICYGELARGYQRLNDKESSKAWREKEIATRAAICRDFPTYPAYFSNLGAAWSNKAAFEYGWGEPGAAEKSIGQALRYQKAALNKLPTHPQFRERMRNHMYIFCQVTHHFGRYKSLVEVARSFAAQSPNPGRGAVEGAMFIALALTGELRHKDPDQAGTREWVTETKDKLFALLDTARQREFLRKAHLEPALWAPVETDPRFVKLRGGLTR